MIKLVFKSLSRLRQENLYLTRLIQLGANIEVRNARQWTALDCASANGWDKAAKLLLEAGASVEPKGKIRVSDSFDTNTVV